MNKITAIEKSKTYRISKERKLDIRSILKNYGPILNDVYTDSHEKHIINDILSLSKEQLQELYIKFLYICGLDVSSDREEKIMKLMLWEENARMNSEEHTKKFSTYILQDKGNKLYKIGRTTNFKNRISIIKTSNPLLKIIGISEMDIESELHEIYKKNRIVREWFSFTEKEINYILKKYGFVSYRK